MSCPLLAGLSASALRHTQGHISCSTSALRCGLGGWMHCWLHGLSSWGVPTPGSQGWGSRGAGSFGEALGARGQLQPSQSLLHMFAGVCLSLPCPVLPCPAGGCVALRSPRPTPAPLSAQPPRCSAPTSSSGASRRACSTAGCCCCTAPPRAPTASRRCRCGASCCGGSSSTRCGITVVLC